MIKKWFLFPVMIVLLILASAPASNNLKDARAASFSGEKTLVLYDAASGDIPDPSLISFNDFPLGAATVTYSDGATILDTTPSGKGTFAGWVASPETTPGFPIMDPKVGVQVNFTLQVEDENHANHNRAGFSAIILDQDAKGIELSFWENEIWAQHDKNTGDLFTHGEGTAFSTTAGLTDYQVTIVGDAYSLTANSQPLLSGPIRDYSTFEGFPDPYETPNFLFLGDDTTSSQARVRLSFISVSGTEPIQPTTTVLSSSTSSPIPTASLTPLPTATPVPSPTITPTAKPFMPCPSGWLFLAVVFTTLIIINQIRR